MIYILFFLICLCLDKYLKRNTKLYYIVAIFVYIFLCFGYTTGSDWRNYEVVYNDELLLEKYAVLEPGFVLLVRAFNVITSDFWVFNALMKCFYLYSLLFFFSYFCSYKWTSLAMSFSFSSLFMLIDCPMRFMIAMGIFLFSCIAYLKGKYVWTTIFSLISVACHITMVVPILLLFSFRLAKSFSKISIFWLIVLYVLSFFLSKVEFIYNYIFNNILGVLGLAKFENSIYTVLNTDGLAILGAFKIFILFMLILLNKKNILKCENGYLIYYISCLYFLSFNILFSIPTGFRFGIFLSYFVSIALSYILRNKIYNNLFEKYLCKKILIALLLITLYKDVYSTYKYYPYTNSIYYILTGHLPYNYRDSYNIVEFKKMTGSNSEQI